jgi:hypothetical protein
LYNEGVKRAKMNDRNVKLLNLKGFIEIMCFPVADEEEEKAKDKKALDEEFARKEKEENRARSDSQTSLDNKKKSDESIRLKVDTEMLEHSEIHIDQEEATIAFAMAQMTTIDEEDRSSADARRDSADFATYVEYLEAIVRVALKTMRGLEVEMMTTPQRLERFLCTVLFPSVGLPEKMYGTKEKVVEMVVEKKKKKKTKKKKKKKGGGKKKTTKK